MASRAERDALNLQEVRDFLSRIGLKQCTDSILNDGLYISMSLLRYATYKELLECKGITPVQAVTVLTSLGATAPRMDASTAELLNAAGVEAGNAMREYDSIWSDSDLVRIVRQFLWETREASWSIQNYDNWRAGHESQFPSTGSLRNRLGTWSEIRVLALEADLPEFDMAIFDTLEANNA